MGSMISDEAFQSKLLELQTEADSITENSDKKSIEIAANTLKGMSYSPTLLFDTPQFVRNLEKAYKEIWKIFLAGEKPRQIEVREE